MFEITFWLLCLAIIYVYILYPLLIHTMIKTTPIGYNKQSSKRKFLRKQFQKFRDLHLTKQKYPMISIIVPCYNEERSLVQKIRNLNQLSYPKHRLEIILINDGSSDRSSKILKVAANQGIKVITNSIGIGKLASMRKAAKVAKGSLLFFSDCSSRIPKNSMQLASSALHAESIGLVTSIYKSVPKDQDNRSSGEGAYWKFECKLRYLESKLQSTTHASGAAFAVKAHLFHQLDFPEDIINDDIFIPLSIAEMGFDIACEPKILSVEYVSTDVKSEFKRRKRIAHGNLQMFRKVFGLYNSHQYFILFQLLSHKLLRNLLSCALPIVFVMNAILIFESPLYILVMAFQIAFYSLAFSAHYNLNLGKLNRISNPIYYFSTANLASLIGLVDWILGRTNIRWEKTDINLEGA